MEIWPGRRFDITWFQLPHIFLKQSTKGWFIVEWSDPKTWEFVNSFAPWLSSIGTILAVIVSLYFSRKGNRIEIEVKAQYGSLFVEGESGARECVWIEATNVGRRTAIVNLVFWRAGIWSKNDYFLKIPVNPRSSGLPTQLLDGQHARWVMDLKEFHQNFKPLMKCLSSNWSALHLWFLKVGIRTSTGEYFVKRAKKSLRDYLRSQLRK